MDRLRPGDPEEIGPYRVVARLGSGGMGVVFLGAKDNQRVAIKVVRNTFLDDPTLRTRFEREIETLARVSSPYVAKLVDSSTDGEFAWHAVEFINGPTLRELVTSQGPLAEDDWWRLAEQLHEALAAVHRLGIVHRDVKPANIIMSETGPKLIDFGISQDPDATSLTTTGLVAGSPAWLSPEQLEGTPVTAGSDLYSLGSVLVFAATGRSPWGDETSMSVPSVYQKILSGEVSLDGLSDKQKDLIGLLHAPDPQQRSFVDVRSTPVERGPSGEPRNQASPIGGGESEPSPPRTATYPGAGSANKEKNVVSIIFGGGIVVGLVLLAGIGIAWLNADSNATQESGASTSQSQADGAEEPETSTGGIDADNLPFELLLTANVASPDGFDARIGETVLHPGSNRFFVRDVGSDSDFEIILVVDIDSLLPVDASPAGADMVVSSDGRFLATSSGLLSDFGLDESEYQDGDCSIFDANTLDFLDGFRTGRNDRCISSFSPDGFFFYLDSGAGSIFAVDPNTMDFVGSYALPDNDVGAILATERYIFLTPSDVTFRITEGDIDAVTVLDRSNGSVVSTLTLSNVYSDHGRFILSPNGEDLLLAVQDKFGATDVWSMNLTTLEANIIVTVEEQGITRTAISPDGRFLAISDFVLGMVRVVDLSKGQVAQSIPHELPLGLAFSPEGDLYISGRNTIEMYQASASYQ